MFRRSFITLATKAPKANLSSQLQDALKRVENAEKVAKEYANKLAQLKAYLKWASENSTVQKQTGPLSAEQWFKLSYPEFNKGQPSGPEDVQAAWDQLQDKKIYEDLAVAHKKRYDAQSNKADKVNEQIQTRRVFKSGKVKIAGKKPSPKVDPLKIDSQSKGNAWTNYLKENLGKAILDVNISALPTSQRSAAARKLVSQNWKTLSAEEKKKYAPK